jgi:nitroreductase
MALTESQQSFAARWDRRPTIAPDDALLTTVRYAVLAPSPCNTQPWRFRLASGLLELWADTGRALAAMDPQGRELAIACGAALRNVRLALRHFGYEGAVDVLPEPERRSLIARVGAGRRCRETAEERVLFHAIDRRRTNRGEFEAREVPREFLDALRGCAMEEGAWLVPLSAPTERERLADLVFEADCVIAADSLLRAELADWVSHPGDGRRDGVPEHLAGGRAQLPREVRGDPGGGVAAGPAMQAVRRIAAHDVRLARAAPVVAVLGTMADEVRDWVAAGEALQHVLLRAAAAGVYASYLNQPLRSERLRPWLEQLAARAGHPQVVICLGYAPLPEATPRRRIGDVLAG